MDNKMGKNPTGKLDEMVHVMTTALKVAGLVVEKMDKKKADIMHQLNLLHRTPEDKMK